MASSKTTTDHKEIQKWAEARDGRPVTVKGTGSKDEPGVLRIDFPGGAGDDRFEEISWDEWFAKFDENELAFLYQDHKADGEESTFFKLVKRENAKERGK
jgi:anaerobic selenocysteine-containing dehydrogenase